MAQWRSTEVQFQARSQQQYDNSSKDKIKRWKLPDSSKKKKLAAVDLRPFSEADPEGGGRRQTTGSFLPRFLRTMEWIEMQMQLLRLGSIDFWVNATPEEKAAERRPLAPAAAHLLKGRHQLPSCCSFYFYRFSWPEVTTTSFLHLCFPSPLPPFRPPPSRPPFYCGANPTNSSLIELSSIMKLSSP